MLANSQLDLMRSSKGLNYVKTYVVTRSSVLRAGVPKTYYEPLRR